MWFTQCRFPQPACLAHPLREKGTERAAVVEIGLFLRKGKLVVSSAGRQADLNLSYGYSTWMDQFYYGRKERNHKIKWISSCFLSMLEIITH